MNRVLQRPSEAKAPEREEKSSKEKTKEVLE